MTSYELCPHCDGEGCHPFSGENCLYCDGDGYEPYDDPEPPDCHTCDDFGQVPTMDYESITMGDWKPCPDCN